MSPAPEDPALTSVSCLSDPVRRQLYEFVAGHPEPVGRDEAAAAAGIGRAIAVYHLDKLVESGLLSASYRRPDGRSGPGAGRPAKFYSRSGREFAVSVPPREYELAAHLLVRAVAADRDGVSQVALREAARQFGEEAGTRYLTGDEEPGGVDGVTDALRVHGFEPWADEDGTVVLRNCPFHRLAVEEREVVCGMNLALVDGLILGMRADGLRAMLDPRPGRCCVVIRGGQPPEEPPDGTQTTGAR